MDALAPLPFALPLLVAALLIAISSFAPHWLLDALSLLTSVCVCVLCVLLLLASANRPIVYWFGGWVPHQDVAVGIAFAIDPMGAGLASMVALLVTAALMFSWKYFQAVGAFYHSLMLIFLGAMCGFALTGDLFNMFVFFELMSAAAYALTGYRIEERGPLQGALNFAIVNTIGAYFVLCGIGLLYGRSGALNFAQIGRAISAHPPDGLVVTAFVLLAVGFLTKAAMVPFHFWLADAHAVAPTPVCVLFSGVMVELGVYAVARLYWTMFATSFGPHEAAVRSILLGAGVVTALVGGIFAFAQAHLKRLLAFSTVSHVGMFVIGFALLTPLGLGGTAVYVLSHGAVKGALFLCTGILLNRFRTVNEAHLHGRGKRLPIVGVLFVLGGLALAGMPPFGTFAGKGMIEDASVSQGYAWLVAVMILASMLTGGAVLRAAARVFGGIGQPEEDEAAREGDEREPESERTGRTPATMLLPACVLMAAGLAIGFIPNMGQHVEVAAARFVNQASYSQVVLDGAPALTPVGDIEPAGPNTFQIASGLGSAAGAILLAFAAINRRKLPRAVCTFGSSVLEPPLQRLRKLQSGDARDYVTWLAFGTAGLGAAFAFLLR
ncbi:MAG TPA: proton-conducting transporter membrane subunit [Chloroflexota bacterium]|nr:proton-conducting transporter membrane subunit [Chloroflexota bacterium]